MENKAKLDTLKEKLNNIIKEKEETKQMIQKIKEDTELLQENMTKKIVELNDGIDLNNKKEREILKEINEVTNKVVIMENKIKKRKEELKAMGVEYKDEEKEKKKKEEEKVGSGNNNNNLILNLANSQPEIIAEDKDENKKESRKKKGSIKKKKKGK